MEFEKLRQIIAEVLSVDPRELKDDTTFAEDLCADSLDLYQIVMGIEETFDIEIAEDKLYEITTVKDAAELIRKAKQS